MRRFDARVNVTIEVPDEEAMIEEYRDDPDDEDFGVEDALEVALEREQPTFEIGQTGASAFIVAAERVTYLDG